MTKADLVEICAEKTGLTRTDVAVTVDAFLEAVKTSLESGKNIEIRGFGTFKVKLRKARKAQGVVAHKTSSTTRTTRPSSWHSWRPMASVDCSTTTKG